MRLIILAASTALLFGSRPLLPPEGPHRSLPCPDPPLPPQPYGPVVAAGDSGLLFSSAVTPDGSEFYYFKHVGPGEEDYRIFRATRGENSWGPAEPLDLGASFSDLYPSISPDGQRLVFASYRPAPGNTSRNRNAHLWMARRIGPRWGPPTFLRVSRLGFYHSGLWQDSTGAVFFSRTTPDWRSTSHFQLEWDGSSFSEEAHPAPQPAAEYLAPTTWR